MSDALSRVYRAVDEQHAEQSALTRRRLVKGTAATLGGLGLLSLPFASAARADDTNNTPENILTVAATAEVLATIVNTVGAARVNLGDTATKRNVRAAAREELLHYDTLTRDFGAKPLTTKIWVPDVVFSSRTALLSTLEVGDQIFVNAYLIGTKAFGDAGLGSLAATAAEFMGVEAVHRALARQSLGKLGNDRVFMKFSQEETAPGAPNRGVEGFTDIFAAAQQLQAAGFGFGAEGSQPGRFYDFNTIRKQTPTDKDLNTLKPVA